MLNDKYLSKKNTRLPKEFKNRIICSDSLHLLKQLPNNCIDLILTSPPYNFGMSYDKYEDVKDWSSYWSTLFPILKQCVRVLKWEGRLIINIQPLFSSYVPSHHIISSFLTKKLLWKAEIIWEKNNYNCKFCSFGSWKSPSSPYMKYTWEFIEVFCKGSLKKQGKSENIDITADEFKSWLVAKWSIAPERRMKEFDHPAMFPESLAERCIKLFSYKKDTILDPFNGVGTTSYVAHKLGRTYLGIDISKKYCSTAKKRLKSLKFLGDY